MAKLTSKKEVVTYNLELSKEELKAIFGMSVLVSGDPKRTYRGLADNIYNVIKKLDGPL